MRPVLLLSPLIPFLHAEPRLFSVSPRKRYTNSDGGLGEASRTGVPPRMPYGLRNHRMVAHGASSSSLPKHSNWWVRHDHWSDVESGPASRRSLDSAVYQILKGEVLPGDEKNDGPGNRRTSIWDWFGSLDNHQNSSSSTSPPSSASSLNVDDRFSASGEKTDDVPGNPIPVPANIDATHFTPGYIPPPDSIEREFMVVSGGFTDTDWSTFPVWAYELNDTLSERSQWRDLSGLELGKTAEKIQKGTEHITWPPGRVGHISSLYKGELYIFGGLLWKDKKFVVEQAPYVWKAKVDHKLNPPDVSLKNTSVLEWEAMLPTVKYYKDMQQDDSAGEEDAEAASAPAPTEEGEEDKSGIQKTLTRGECRGGHWAGGSSLVFYGGLHVRHKLSGHYHKEIQEDIALGDVWLYNYTTSTFEQLAPYPPPHSQRDEFGRYPVARTAHAAAVVGDSLFVYGGMTSSSWSSRGDDGIGVWDELSDLWAFDLVERRWSERIMMPALSRSYHSMVGWGDGSLAVFGGFRTANTISGEPIAFVFSDTLVSHPNDPTWWKAQWPQEAGFSYEEGASNRLEHTAAVDKYGSMYVWGGRFKTVSQVSGMWSLDVFGAESNVDFEPAPPDGLEAYEAELEALHMLVAVMLLMSVLFTALYGTLRRQAEQQNGGGNGNAVGILGRRRGLSRAAIDALPTKTYGGDDSSSRPSLESDTEAEESDRTGLSDIPLEEEECCPVCLCEYREGDQLRLLPCNHEFHTDCIDSWLENNTSCPACRHSLSNSVADPSTSNEDSPSHSTDEPDGVWRVEYRLEPISFRPTLSLSHVLAGRERGWFGEPLGEATDENSIVEEGSNATAFDADAQDVGESSRRRPFRFTRYFRLPLSRTTNPLRERLGETEMTTIGETSETPPQVV